MFVIGTTLFLVIVHNNVNSLKLGKGPIYSLDEAPILFEQFIEQHNKKYDDKQKEERFNIFVDNLKNINSLNEQSSNAVYGINKFSDLSAEEFKQLYTGLDPKQRSWNDDYKTTDVALTFNNTAPDEFDWRSKGVVSSVKNQGECGSCWAFGVCGNVESINAIKTGSMVEASEQQLVDCDENSSGCSGGDPIYAMKYFLEYGVMSLSSYPYVSADQDCHYDSKKVVIRLESYKQILNLTEDQIKEHLYNIGPLSIALVAQVLPHYTEGIIVEDCNKYIAINHAVLLVGYGKEKDVEYWIIKNSWGLNWGEKGYFRIKKGVNCLKMADVGITTAFI